MKTIIDESTGELIEVEDSNEIAERKLMEVGAIDEQTYDFLEEYRTMMDRYDTFRYILEKAMRENGIKKWDNDYFSATIKEESVSKRIDTEKLKDDGLYEKYTKLSYTKPGLMIKFKER